jgi:type II secretory pathway predicted ATPase ExeA
VFTEFHGLSESPFTIMPNPRLAWLGSGMRKVRAELCNAVLEGRGLVVLSGGPGVGKSLALTLLASDLKQSGVPYRIHALNCGLQVSATELLRRVAEDAAGDDRAPATDRLTVLLMDEAQHLGSAELGEFLQETALRGDRLCLVLAGSPELELAVNEALAEHPGMVAEHWSLEPLPPDEISSYIAGRLRAAGGGGREIFMADAIECLTRHSGGVPCRLNVLCSTALFLAWQEGRQDVGASIVEAALPAFNLTGSLTDAAEPPLPAPISTSTYPPVIEAAALPEAKDLLMAKLESAVFEASTASGALDGVRSEAMEFVTAEAAQSIAPQTILPETAGHRPGAARVETCEHVPDVAVAATPVSRDTALLQPKAEPVARQHPPVLVPIWARIRRRPALYVPVTGVAAIVFLLVAIDWRARDEQPAGHANPPITTGAILPVDPPIIAAPSQPTASSSSPSTVAAEPVAATAPAEAIAAMAPVSAGAVASVASDDAPRASPQDGGTARAGGPYAFHRPVAVTAPAEAIAAMAPVSAGAVASVASDEAPRASPQDGGTARAGGPYAFHRPVAVTAPTESVAAVAPLSDSGVILVPSDDGPQDSQDADNTDKAGDTNLFYLQVFDRIAPMARMSTSAVTSASAGELQGEQGTRDTDESDGNRSLPKARTARAASSTAVLSVSISASPSTGVPSSNEPARSNSPESSSDQSGSDQSSSDQSGSDQSGSDQSGSDQSGSDQSSSDQISSDQSSSDQSSSDQISSDQSSSDQSGSDQSGSDQSGSDQSSSDQISSDQSSSDQSSSDQISSYQISSYEISSFSSAAFSAKEAEKAAKAAEKAAKEAEKAAKEKAAKDKAAKEKAAKEKAAKEKAAKDKGDKDKGDKDKGGKR